MSNDISPWGILPEGWKVSTIDAEKTQLFDYVANGSFASLAENVQYKQEEDYAVLIRLVDYNNGFKDNFVYITEHAYNYLGKSKLFGGEIIISNVGANVGTVFKAPYLKKPMSLAPNAICVKLKGNNDFYYYWFKSRFGQHLLNSLVSGSAQPKFNKTHFKSMSIPVPPIHEQEEIASILSSLDEKIAVNKKICENLEAQAQALFRHWFVDFAPFKDGNFCANREQNETCFNSAEVQPKITGKACKFVESELGLIPEGWRVGKLGDIAEINPTRKLSKGQIATYLDMKNMPTSGSFPLNWEEKEFTGGMRFKNGDTLMARITPCLENGKVAYVNFLQDEEIGFGSTEYIVMTAKQSIFPELLYTLCRFPLFVGYATKHMNGSSGRQRVSGDSISNYPMVLAPDAVYNQLRPIFENFMRQIREIGFENLRLSTLRDTLLPKLMSGEIKINEIEKSL